MALYKYIYMFQSPLQMSEGINVLTQQQRFSHVRAHRPPQELQLPISPLSFFQRIHAFLELGFLPNN